MPRYECVDCGRLYWGWGARHLMNSGRGMICPECEGALVERKDSEPKREKKADGTEAA